jgi:hypothetical protein
MEKLAHTIENMLGEKICLYRKLKTLLEQEKRYVADMDTAALWETAAQKKQIVIQLETLRRDLLGLLEKRSTQLNMGDSPFKLVDFVKRLPDSKETKSRLNRIVLDLEYDKKEVSTMAEANKKYIHEYLSVINDIFSIAVDSADKRQYNPSGSFTGYKEKNRLINAEV